MTGEVDGRAGRASAVVEGRVRRVTGRTLKQFVAEEIAGPLGADFQGGWGGWWETMNPDRRMTTAYVMNKIGPGVEGSERTARYTTLIYDAVS